MSYDNKSHSVPKYDLEPLCNPKSIAIIGCSNDLNRLSGRPLKFLLKYNYSGKIYPINPKYDKIEGLACYPSVVEVPEQVDVAMVLVAANQVERMLRECIAAKVRSVIISTSGFAELGKEGQEAQDRIQAIAEEAGIPVLGPNCLGIINLVDGIPLSFSSALDYDNLAKGGLALVTQSGAIGSYILGVCAGTRVGFSYMVITGNEAVVEASSIVKYLLQNDKVSGVLMYMEESRNPQGLIEAGKVAQEVGKPLVCLKVGRSASGMRAAVSHTGAMAGADREYDAAFAKTGIVRAENLEELLDLGVVCSQTVRPEGKRVGVITLSGGCGIMAADECEKLGLEVPELSLVTQNKLAQVVPPFGSVKNPVDLTAEIVASPELLKKSMEVLLDCNDIDSLMLYLGLQKKNAVILANDIVEIVKTTQKNKNKPVVVGWMAPPPEAVEILRKAEVPLVFDGIRAINALAKLSKPVNPVKSTCLLQPKEDLRDLLFSMADIDDVEKEQFTLTEYAGKKYLGKIGLPIPRGGLADSAEQAAALADRIGYPVVVKINSPDIMHKSDVGAVKIGLKNEAELRQAYEEIMDNSRNFNPQARLQGVLLEKMVEDGLQTIVGLKFSEKFGPMVVFGVGGIFVEILKDFSMRLAPVDENEALKMISELKAYKMFTGARGSAPRDIKATARAIAAISRLGAKWGSSLQELDINPLFVLKEGEGVIVGDALFSVRGRCK